MKKNMTKRLFFGLTVLITALAVIFSACPNDTTTTTVAAPSGPTGPTGPVLVPVTGVVLNMTSFNLNVGKAYTLRETIEPVNTTGNKNVTWSSNNEAVATVSGGMVYGVAVSATPVTITVTTVEGGFTATCEVTVVATGGLGTDYVPVESVSLSQTTLEIELGDVKELKLTVLPEDATNRNVTWNFSNPGIIEITGDYARALVIGSTVVTVTSADNDAKSAQCTVNVVAPSEEYKPPENPNPGDGDIDIGDTGGVDPTDPTQGGNATLKDDDLTLSVTIDGDDPITNYQWYKAVSADSYTGATKIPGANGPTKSTYTPDTSQTGTFHYFVEITFQSGKKQVSAIKTVSVIVLPPVTPPGGEPPPPNPPGDNENHGVNANQPKITQQPTPADKWYARYTLAANVTPIVVKANKISAATGRPDGGVLSYQWYRNTTNSNSGGIAIPAGKGTLTDQDGADQDVEIKYTPLTDSMDNNGITYYYVEVTNTLVNPPNDGGLHTRTVKSLTTARVEVRDLFSVDGADNINPALNKLTIKTHPADINCMEGAEAILTAEVNPVKNDNSGTIPGRTPTYSTLTYQWYKVGTNSNSGGTAIPDMPGNPAKGQVPDGGLVSYKADTGENFNVDYYYCEFTNTLTDAELPKGPNNTNLVFAPNGKTKSVKTRPAFVGVGVQVNNIAYDPTGAKGIFVVTREYNGNGPANQDAPDISRDVEIRGNLGVASVLSNGNGIRWGNSTGIEIRGWTRTNKTWTPGSAPASTVPTNGDYWYGTAKGRIKQSAVGKWEVEIVDMYLDGENSNTQVLSLPYLEGTITKAPGTSVIRPTTAGAVVKGKNFTMAEASQITKLSNANTQMTNLWAYHQNEQTVIEYAFSTQSINNNTACYNVSIPDPTTGLITVTPNTAVTNYLPDNKWTTELTLNGLPKADYNTNNVVKYYVYARAKATDNFRAGNVFLCQDASIAYFLQSGEYGSDSYVIPDVGSEITVVPTSRIVTDGTITINNDARAGNSAKYNKVTNQTIEYYITNNANLTEAQANAVADNLWQDGTLPNGAGLKFGFSNDPLKAWGTLDCNTNYYVWSRAKANDNFYAGKARISGSMPTEKSKVYFETNSKGINFSERIVWDTPMTLDVTNTPTRTGYIFEGWYADPQGIKPFDHTAKIKASVKIYGMWIKETDLNDIPNKLQTKQYGDMTYVKGGWFIMGSPNHPGNNDSIGYDAGQGSRPVERPLTPVGITGFWMGIHEITQDSYTTVRGVSNPSGFTTGVTAGEVQGKRPVENVSWYEAIAYCNQRSKAEFGDYRYAAYTILGSKDPDAWAAMGQVPIDNNTSWNRVTVDNNAIGYRLPTEAQWEYACRANTNPNLINNTSYANSRQFYGYSNYWCKSQYLDRNYAWYSSDNNNAQGNSGTTAHAGSKTHEVGKKLANAFGLYDMHGNVAEWVWDFSPENILPYDNAAYTTAYADRGDFKNVNPDGLKYNISTNSTYYYHIPRGGAWSSDSFYNTGGTWDTINRYQPLRSAARGLTSNALNDINAGVKAIPPYQKQNTVGFRVIRPLMTEITNETSVPRVVYVAPAQ